MGCKSSDVLRFDLVFLLQGRIRIAKFKVLKTRLLLVLEVCNVKNNPVGNHEFLMWLDLTLGPSFKVT